MRRLSSAFVCVAACAATLSVSAPLWAQSWNAETTLRSPIAGPRGEFARGGGDTTQRDDATPRSNLRQEQQACLSSCESEAELESIRECSKECLELYSRGGNSLPFGWIEAGIVVQAVGAVAVMGDVVQVCDVEEGDQSFGACEASLLVGGLTGVVIGAVMVAIGAQEDPLVFASTPASNGPGLSLRF